MKLTILKKLSFKSFLGSVFMKGQREALNTMGVGSSTIGSGWGLQAWG